MNVILFQWLDRNYDIDMYGLLLCSALVNDIGPISCALDLTVKKRNHLYIYIVYHEVFVCIVAVIASVAHNFQLSSVFFFSY